MKRLPKAVVIFFPGTNCEVETARFLRDAGMDAEIIYYNKFDDLSKFDVFVIPGGFSFEDRGRSGMIASFFPIITEIENQAKKGKIIFGICNGAQIIAESNILGFPVVIDRNYQMENKKIRQKGFFSDDVFIKNNLVNVKTPFNFLCKNEVLKMPVAHADGRFFSTLGIKDKNILYKYTDENGNIIDGFPVNPNGSLDNCSAVINDAGNVCAMMPHPERSKDGKLIFQSIKSYFDENKVFESVIEMSNKADEEEIKLDIKEEKIVYDFEFFLNLKITDNEQWSIKKVLKMKKFGDFKLDKYLHFSFTVCDRIDILKLEKIISEFIFDFDFVNLYRENLIVHFDDDFYFFDEKNLVKKDFIQNGFFIKKRLDIDSASIKDGLMNLKSCKIKDVKTSIFWNLDSSFDFKEKKKLLKSGVFVNFESGFAQIF